MPDPFRIGPAIGLRAGITACLLLPAFALAGAGEPDPAAAIAARLRAHTAADACVREIADARRVHRADLDGDGARDVLVLYHLEGAGCGNSDAQHLAVLMLTKGRYRLAGEARVGGKWYRHVDFERVRVADGRIQLATRDYAEGDAACCPSMEGRAVYAIRKGRLVEEKERRP